MAGWRSPNQRDEALPGEYVVRHERPYPERMERAFRIGAAGAAVAADAMFVAWYFAATGHSPTMSSVALAAVTIGAAVAALAYGAVRACGMVLAGIVTAFRLKRYVVDWQDEPPASR